MSTSPTPTSVLPRPRYSVVVPVYNEAANIENLCARVMSQFPPGFELLICYDFEGDSTIPALHALPAHKKPANVRPVLNTLGRGVRYAIEAGFRAAQAPAVLVTMADLSDESPYVENMIRSVEEGAWMSCGSRYMKGGRQVGGPFIKRTLSRVAGMTLYWLTGVPTHDATNSFKVYSKAFLDSVTIESKAGFSLGMELCVKAHFAGGRVTEFPATWYDRLEGKSRFRLWAWMPTYLKWYFYAYKKRYFGWLFK